ncbi:DDE-type integrase/transposase/recombinase [Providencia rettgeri]|nr:DDE-type integrase/transposase/recombinase [Providencia rettgeri]
MTDNGSAYLTHEMRWFAKQVGLSPRHTAVHSPQSNSISELFVKIMKQDYVSLMPKPKEAAIKWSAAPDMTPQTVLYRRPVAQFSNFQPKIVSSWLILALFQANFLISGRSRLCPYQLVNSNQVRQGE